jgi:hypothetical protein
MLNFRLQTAEDHAEIVEAAKHYIPRDETEEGRSHDWAEAHLGSSGDYASPERACRIGVSPLDLPHVANISA